MNKNKASQKFLGLVKESFTYFSPSNVKQGIKRFTPMAAVLSLILIVIFLVLALVEIPILKDNFIERDINRIPYSLVIALIITLIWFSVGVWAGPRLGKFLAQNFVGQKAITGSSIVYFEDLTEQELKVSPGHVLSRFIGLLIAWTSISSTLVAIVAGFIYDSDPDRLQEFLQSRSLLDIFLKILLVLVIAPLILTLFIPVSWMLLDVHMKAWNKKKRTAWYVGTKVENRTKGYIAAGAIIASAGAIGLDQLNLVVKIFLLNIAWIGLACVLVVLQYSLLFHAGYRDIFLETITIPFGLTELSLADRVIAPEEPTEEPIPKEPAEEPIPKEPTEKPIPKEPAEEPIPKEPTEKPIPKEPTEEPIPEEPTEEPIPEEPTEEQATDESLEEPSKNRTQREDEDI